LGCDCWTCDDIANCIDTSALVQNTLAKYISTFNQGNEYIVNNYVMTTQQIADNRLPDGYLCDSDHLMGMARSLLAWLDAVTREVLQSIEAAMSLPELAIALGDNFEVVSWFTSLAEILQWFQDNLLDVYDAAYTQVVQDQLACQLYCLFSQECVVSVELIEQAYVNLLQEIAPIPTDQSMNSWLQWILDHSIELVGPRLVQIYHAWALQAVKHGSTWGLVSGVRSLDTMIILSQDETDTSWILCDCFPEDYQWNFTEGMDTWTILLGSYTAGVGVRPAWNAFNNNQYGLRVELILDTPINLDSVYVRLDQQVTGGVGSGWRLYLYDSTDTQITFISNLNLANVYERTFDSGAGSWSDCKRVRIECIHRGNPDTGLLQIVNFVVL